MATKIHLNNNLIATVILASAILISSVIVARVATAASVFDIEFPVAELGNCANKSECKAFCGEAENEIACQAFATKYNLGDSKEEVDDKFKIIEADGGPGSCAVNSGNPRASCEKFCNQSVNMRECVAYAKKNNLMPQAELEEAEKVIKALDSGVKLPAACTDERSCKSVCEEPKDTATARSCFEFAEQAGLLPPGVDRDKAEKMFKAIEEGRAPFRSPKEFEQCENPPNDEVFEKCLNFALESGMIPPEEAEIVKKTGGKGPGGCRGKEQCETYCENNQDVCFQFADEHGLISEADRARMKEGTEQFRSSLEEAPPEVSVCLKETVGAEVLDQMSAGTKPPSRELGEKMKQCFENFFKNNQGPNGQGGFDGEGKEGDFGSQSGGRGAPGFPPEVKACLESKLGAEGLESLQKTGDPMKSENRATIEECFKESFGGEGGGESSRPENRPEGGFSEREFKGRPSEGQDYEKIKSEMMERERSRIGGEIQNQIYDEKYRRQYDERMREFQESGGGFSAPPTGSGTTYPVPPSGSEGSYPIPPMGGANFPPPTDSTREFVLPPTEVVPPPTDMLPPPPSEPTPTSAVQSLVPSPKSISLLANAFSALISLFEFK